VGDRIRTGDVQIHSQQPDARNLLPDNTSGDVASRFAHGFAQSGQNLSHGPTTAALADPDLTRIFSIWPTLPPPIRRAILALIESAG
jgi:hypothetical protein